MISTIHSVGGRAEWPYSLSQTGQLEKALIAGAQVHLTVTLGPPPFLAYPQYYLMAEF
jgi:hypothetical protein